MDAHMYRAKGWAGLRGAFRGLAQDGGGLKGRAQVAVSRGWSRGGARGGLKERPEGGLKAVMISHDNIIFESFCLAQLLHDEVDFGKGQERILSYLPLSHVAGFMVGICLS